MCLKTPRDGLLLLLFARQTVSLLSSQQRTRATCPTPRSKAGENQAFDRHFKGNNRNILV
jgi:hypothetical protein